jgi:diguanylate cyclase (GGDEF)-like protein
MASRAPSDGGNRLSIRTLEGTDTRISAELEGEYHSAKFSEYRILSLRIGIAGVFFAAFLWLRDFVGDPVGARDTFIFRVLIALAVLIYVISVSVGLRRTATLAIAYLALAAIELLIVILVPKLSTGYPFGILDFLFIYLLAPLVLLPYRFWENAAALLMCAALPNVFVLFDLAPGFPLALYNVMAWPACLVAVYAQHQFDELFRRVFLYRKQIHELALNDALTGLGNRRYFMDRANESVSRARRHSRQLCILALDIDHFKAVNDRYGHAAGDDVLRSFATTLLAQLRTEDICGRTGGEEFGVMLPDSSPHTGVAVAERIRKAVETSVATTRSTNQVISVTVSIGVASFPRSGQTLEQLLHQADMLLYEAKNSGRNRVVGHPD